MPRDGGPKGTFHRDLHGGRLTWDGRAYAIRRLSLWRARYALCDADGDRELLALRPTGFSRRPMEITAGDAGALDPGLVLFAVFCARKLGRDRSVVGGVADVVSGGQT